MGTTAYTIIAPKPADLPAGLVVRIVVMREDGKQLSREELSALVDTYPPRPSERAAALQAIEDAPSRAASTRAPKARASKASAPRSSGASKPRPKRAAAKAPARSK